jgi:hypothetical protein
MRENRREEAAGSFPAWRQHLEQVAEPRLQHELQTFWRLLVIVGTPLIDGRAIHCVYYHPRTRQANTVTSAKLQPPLMCRSRLLLK